MDTWPIILLLAVAGWTNGDEEVPCVVPEGMTDPYVFVENEPEPLGGSICHQPGVMVQELHYRCEKRYCCRDKCSCDDVRTLEDEFITTCPASSQRSIPVVYNCYVQNRVLRDYLKICCPGYKEVDRICERNIDCSVDNGGCAGTCVTIDGKGVCQCDDGYMLVDETECEDVDECLDNPCGSIHECGNLRGSYECKCQEGYRSNGQTCEDVNECDEGTHSCQGDCYNTMGSYTCSCPPGYVLQPSGDCADTTTTTTTTPVPVAIVPQQSRQESPGGPPSYVYIVAALASLVILLLLLALLLLLRRKRAKKLSHSASAQTVQVDAFDNAAYGMTTPTPLPPGAVGGHDYEELPPLDKKKKLDDDDLGEQAQPLPYKVPLDGATGGQNDGHYETLPDMDKVKLEEELGKEHGNEAEKGQSNKGFYENLPSEKNDYDVPRKF